MAHDPFIAACEVLNGITKSYSNTLSSEQQTLHHGIATAYARGDRASFESTKHAAGASFGVSLSYDDSSASEIRDVWTRGNHDEAIKMAKAKLYTHSTGPPPQVAIAICNALTACFVANTSGSSAIIVTSHGAMPRGGNTTVVTVRFNPNVRGATADGVALTITGGTVKGTLPCRLTDGQTASVVVRRTSDEQVVVRIDSAGAGSGTLVFAKLPRVVTIVNAVSGRKLYAQTMGKGGTGWDKGVGAGPGDKTFSDNEWLLVPSGGGTFCIVNAASGRKLYAQTMGKGGTGWDKGVGAGPGDKTFGDNKWQLYNAISCVDELVQGH